jgi:hypothetical protein
MKRIIYYVWHCTTQERDKGIDHLEPFDSEVKAIKRAKEIPADEFVSIEKRHEIYERLDWQPDFNFESETIDF